MPAASQKIELKDIQVGDVILIRGFEAISEECTVIDIHPCLNSRTECGFRRWREKYPHLVERCPHISIRVQIEGSVHPSTKCAVLNRLFYLVRRPGAGIINKVMEI